MWLLLAFLSAALLGFYDVFKKKSLRDNAVLPVPVSYTHLTLPTTSRRQRQMCIRDRPDISSFHSGICLCAVGVGRYDV